VWRRVALVDDVQGPKLKRTTIDTTTHDVTDDYMAYVPSLKDGQEVTLTAMWDPNDASHDESMIYSMKQAFEDGNTRQWRVVYPTSPARQIAFNGFVTTYEPGAKVKDVLRINMGIKTTGGSTLAAKSSTYTEG
jgi:predicted secreted protein